MHIILGCDDVGKEALSFYRKMNSSPDCLFCDVDDIRNGDIIEGTRVISFKEMKNKSDDSDIVIADEYAYDRIAVKLWEAGIRKFNIYFNKNGGYGAYRDTMVNTEYSIIYSLELLTIAI